MKEPILQMENDEMIPIYVLHNHSRSGYLIDVNGAGELYPVGKCDSSGIQMGPRQMKALEPGLWPWYEAEI
jgi:hypothetical protein